MLNLVKLYKFTDVITLCQLGISPDSQIQDGVSPLIFACNNILYSWDKEDFKEMVLTFIRYGSNVNIEAPNLLNPLTAVVYDHYGWNGALDIAKELIKFGAKLSPDLLLAKNTLPHPNMVKLLIDSGINLKGVLTKLEYYKQTIENPCISKYQDLYQNDLIYYEKIKEYLKPYIIKESENLSLLRNKLLNLKNFINSL